MGMLLAVQTPVQAAPSAYVVNFCASSSNCNNGTVSVIDTATNAVTDTIQVGYSPTGVAVSPDGSQVYVANFCASSSCTSTGTVSVIDTASNTVTDTIAVGVSPQGVAVSPDGSRVYVADRCASSSTCPNGTVSVIDTAKNVVTATIAVGVGPGGVAVSPDGSQVYVANSGSNTVSVIDTATNAVTAVISVGSNPFGVAVSPDGSRVYVVNLCASSGCPNGTVSVIDTAKNVVTATIPVGGFPEGVAVSPDGSQVYVTNGGGTVSVIDTATNAVTGSAITVGSSPEGVAVSPDGSRVYVANSGSGTVSVIDTASDSVVTTITVGANPSSLGAFVGPGALIATNSSASGVEGEQISGMVPALTNTSSCATSDAVVQDPTRGTLVFDSGTGAYTYTPTSATYVGPDAFTWNGAVPGTCAAADNPTTPVSNVATVTFTLTVPLPVASDGSVTTAEGQAVTGQLSATGPSGQTLTYAVVTGPVHGTVTLTASTGAFSYTPAAGFAGADAFTFDTTDSGGTSNTATETVSVIAPPVASGGAVSTAEGQTVTGQLSATGSSGQTLTYVLVTEPGHGTVTLGASTGVFTYTPAAGFSGTDAFTFDAKDSGGTSNTATETVSVNAAPPAAPDTDGGGGALGLDSLGVLGAGFLFRRSRRKKRLSPG